MPVVDRPTPLEALPEGDESPRIDHTVTIVLLGVACTTDVVFVKAHVAIGGIDCALDGVLPDIIMALPFDLETLLPRLVVARDLEGERELAKVVLRAVLPIPAPPHPRRERLIAGGERLIVALTIGSMDRRMDLLLLGSEPAMHRGSEILIIRRGVRRRVLWVEQGVGVGLDSDDRTMVLAVLCKMLDSVDDNSSPNERANPSEYC